MLTWIMRVLFLLLSFLTGRCPFILLHNKIMAGALHDIGYIVFYMPTTGKKVFKNHVFLPILLLLYFTDLIIDLLGCLHSDSTL